MRSPSSRLTLSMNRQLRQLQRAPTSQLYPAAEKGYRGRRRAILRLQTIVQLCQIHSVAVFVLRRLCRPCLGRRRDRISSGSQLLCRPVFCNRWWFTSGPEVRNRTNGSRRVITTRPFKQALQVAAFGLVQWSISGRFGLMAVGTRASQPLSLAPLAQI